MIKVYDAPLANVKYAYVNHSSNARSFTSSWIFRLINFRTLREQPTRKHL